MTHAHIYTFTYRHTCIHIYIHTHTHTYCTHTHTVHTHTLTFTHIHIHTEETNAYTFFAVTSNVYKCTSVWLQNKKSKNISKINEATNKKRQQKKMRAG